MKNALTFVRAFYFLFKWSVSTTANIYFVLLLERLNSMAIVKNPSATGLSKKDTAIAMRATTTGKSVLTFA